MSFDPTIAPSPEDALRWGTGGIRGWPLDSGRMCSPPRGGGIERWGRAQRAGRKRGAEQTWLLARGAGAGRLQLFPHPPLDFRKTTPRVCSRTWSLVCRAPRKAGPWPGGGEWRRHQRMGRLWRYAGSLGLFAELRVGCPGFGPAWQHRCHPGEPLTHLCLSRLLF